MAYETVLFLHIASFVWNISLVILADSVGLLWVLGKLKKLPATFLTYAHRLIWVGFTVSIITGATMFVELRDYLLSTPAFYTKVVFVLALMINAFFITKHLKTAIRVGTFSDLTKNEKRAFFISGGISSVSWIAVFVSAKMLGL